MATNKFQLARFRIIDRELQRNDRVKTKDIIKILNHEFDIKVSSRTIQKDIELMKYDSTLGYYAPIEKDSKTKSWYYSKPNFSISRLNLKDEEIRALSFYANIISIYKDSGIFNQFSNAIEKVLEAVTIQEISINDEGIDSLIHIDQQPNSSGGEFIPEIITAIREKRYVEFQYQKFEDSEPSERLLMPYLLKLFENRWYIIGQLEQKEKFYTFSLDRIKNLKITAEFFQRIKVDFNLYFQNAFGITVNIDEPVEIILSFTPKQGKYIKTLPLHSTQKILIDNKHELRISILLKPAYELYSKILGYGDTVKVISPPMVVEEIKRRLKKALKYYS